MNYKKMTIKVVIALAIALILQEIGMALDAGVTNEMALQQMQNTSTTLLTNQMFNKTMMAMDMAMLFILGLMFSPEAKYIITKLKGDAKNVKKD